MKERVDGGGEEREETGRVGNMNELRSGGGEGEGENRAEGRSWSVIRMVGGVEGVRGKEE